jgi:phage gp36-like protein
MLQTLNPDEVKQVVSAIDQIEDSMLRSESERDLLKDITDTIKEKYEIAPALLKKVARYNIDSAKKDKAEEDAENVDYLFQLLKDSK